MKLVTHLVGRPLTAWICRCRTPSGTAARACGTAGGQGLSSTSPGHSNPLQDGDEGQGPPLVQALAQRSVQRLETSRAAASNTLLGISALGTPIVGREAKSTGLTIFLRMSWTTCMWRRKQTSCCKPPRCCNCHCCCKFPPTTRGQSTALSTQHACGVCKKQQLTPPDICHRLAVCLKCKRTGHKMVDYWSTHHPFPNASSVEKEKGCGGTRTRSARSRRRMPMLPSSQRTRPHQGPLEQALC